MADQQLGRYARRKDVTPSKWTQTLAVFAAIIGVHALIVLFFLTRPEPEQEMREVVTYYDIAVFSPQTGDLVPLASQLEAEDSASARAARGEAQPEEPALP